MQAPILADFATLVARFPTFGYQCCALELFSLPSNAVERGTFVRSRCPSKALC